MIEMVNDQHPDFDLSKAVQVLYTNYRGETAVRHIIPQKIWFGETEWHSGGQWLLDAIDVEKKAVRSFSMKDIKAWFV